MVRTTHALVVRAEPDEELLDEEAAKARARGVGPPVLLVLALAVGLAVLSSFLW